MTPTKVSYFSENKAKTRFLFVHKTKNCITHKMLKKKYEKYFLSFENQYLFHDFMNIQIVRHGNDHLLLVVFDTELPPKKT